MRKASLVTVFSTDSSEYKATLLQMPLYVAALRLSNQLNKCMVWDVVKCRQSFGQSSEAGTLLRRCKPLDPDGSWFIPVHTISFYVVVVS
jgi:hypothetical protein